MKLSEHAKTKMYEYGIPEYMHGGIVCFYENGLPPGHFLSAIIDNDLKEVFNTADDTNAACVKAYVMWFYNCAPSGTWGHAGATEEWLTALQRPEKRNLNPNERIQQEAE